MSYHLRPEKRAIVCDLLQQGCSLRDVMDGANVAKGTVVRYRRLIREYGYDAVVMYDGTPA